ncbi:hypothetical protein DPMN_016781 [Dreissena polymorpha]|uniref:DUF4371 domain-containing protein n=1 Tax=Dreissena polymorpha TaxID=45954 RepID=A0A9D4NDP9_DREPO|nr:hypothetical protein DPMN_016781 [Dreissena polymorpha]
MSAVVTKILEELGLDISNLRGQCYDNASNFLGFIQDFKHEFENSTLLHIMPPCAAHSLNLVGSAPRI